MLISRNWLNQFLKLDQDSEEIAELLTDLGLEVAGVSRFESIPGGLQGVVVGHVLDCKKHPNADRLWLTSVDIGTGDPLSIVCGAPNVAEGQKVPVATIGTTLHTEEGEAWKIKKGKIRGEVSEGMICAEDELGVGISHEGIMVLDEKLKPGTPCSEIFDLEVDEVFDIDLTPNRADAMSHLGVARDLKAGLTQQEKQVQLLTPSLSKFTIDNRSLMIDVSVEDNELAPRYCGITLSGLTVKPSPSWLQNRLKAIGLKPINNIVDATNFVLHELGQPLHAFDADRIYGKKVIVKRVKAGTTFVTLDGEERTLHEDDLMICDAEKPMCIAGIFGGINTGVTEDTTAIFLESAYFDPISVRRTAKRHGLQTDASFRFERGIDIAMVDYSLKRAALLIREVAGGYITSNVVDLYPKKKEDFQVFLTFKKIDQLVGQEIPRDVIKSILASLEIQVKSVTESGLGLEIPSYRVDVQREVDVIEEILRVYGYNKIGIPGKFNTSVASTSVWDAHVVENGIGDYLAANGFFEIVCSSLTKEEYRELEPKSGQKNIVEILNPLSSDQGILRPNLLYTGLETVAYNLNRKQQNLRFFEFGTSYHRSGKTHEEVKRLGLLVTGEHTESSWAVPGREAGFFYLKSVVENIMHRLGIKNFEAEAGSTHSLSEGLKFKLGKLELASLGIIEPSLLKEFDIRQQVLYADINWDNVLNSMQRSRTVFQSIPKYPEVKRDLALLLDDGVTFQQVHDLALRTEKKLLKDVGLFDVYTGSRLPANKKSYAVSFTLQDEAKTLTDKQIDRVMTRLQKRFEEELGAELR